MERNAPENISVINELVVYNLDLFNPTSTWFILDSWGVCVWSLMTIGVKEKQLYTPEIISSINQYIVTLTFWELDLLK